VENLLHAGLVQAASSAALALLVAAVATRLRRPAFVHALWLLVLLKLVTPSWWRLPITQRTHPQVEAAQATPPRIVDASSLPVYQLTIAVDDPPLDGRPSEDEVVLLADPASSPPTAEPPWWVSAWSEVNWPTVLGVAWVGGSSAWFLAAALRISRFRRVLSLAKPDDGELAELVDRCSDRIGLRRPPLVAWLPGEVAPLVWWLGGRPRLLMPLGLWPRLDKAGRSALILHELAHIKRRDHWVRALELVATGLYWWNPVVWWARRELREAEEECCDAWVVWARPEASRSYATALLEAVEFLSERRTPLPIAASGLGHVHQLKRRLTMILRGNTPRSLNGLTAITLAGLATLILPIAPSLAQKPDEVPGQRERIAVVGSHDFADDDGGLVRRYFGIRSDEPGNVTLRINLEGVDPSAHETLLRLANPGSVERSSDNGPARVDIDLDLSDIDGLKAFVDVAKAIESSKTLRRGATADGPDARPRKPARPADREIPRASRTNRVQAGVIAMADASATRFFGEVQKSKEQSRTLGGGSTSARRDAIRVHTQPRSGLEDVQEEVTRLSKDVEERRAALADSMDRLRAAQQRLTAESRRVDRLKLKAEQDRAHAERDAASVKTKRAYEFAKQVDEYDRRLEALLIELARTKSGSPGSKGLDDSKEKTRRLDELEKQVDALQGEIGRLKSRPARPQR
jgi:beta-lactamase regulating signal transducer with metallopeptidase domain/TolA-binding protein